jgi:hypothetical protein
MLLGSKRLHADVKYFPGSFATGWHFHRVCCKRLNGKWLRIHRTATKMAFAVHNLAMGSSI